MTFTINKEQENLVTIMRRLRYAPLGYTEKGELNCVRPIGRLDYPRFHIYAKEEGDKFIFNLHLDQKKPSYKGSTAHSGEYEGELVEEEAGRIKQAIENI